MLGKNAEKELLANMEEIRYMTRSIVRKSAIFAKYMDIEDFYQEAYIEYLQSVDSYDHTKGKSLHNYAYSRIRHRLMSIFRKNRNIYQEYGSNKLEEQLSCRQDVESELRAAEFAVDYLEVEKEMMKVYIYIYIWMLQKRYSMESLQSVMRCEGFQKQKQRKNLA